MRSSVLKPTLRVPAFASDHLELWPVPTVVYVHAFVLVAKVAEA